ncbi:MAG TPA: hypothetical protein VH333_02325 [Pseudonocardiaceae bacterium]|jgi:hypothetical protein|nr:hypothetical protein [Pseudonocardiaceae bacterium]
MDMANPFETPNTYRLHRAEYLVGLAVVIGLMIAHIGSIRWIPAVVLFVYIDLIGYIPGAIAYRRSQNHRIHKGFFIAYNTMHSLITQAAVAGLWMLFVGPEWALLVLPLHLFADRGVFGNFLKPFSLPFEPEPNPFYQKLISELRFHRGTTEPVPARTENDDFVTAEAAPGL